MDKIPDLLKNFGVLGIVLAIIAITDIPKAFFGALITWFFEKKRKTYWPPEPTRSKFILPVIGYWRFRKTKSVRQTFFFALLAEKKSKISQLFKVVANISMSFKSFQSRQNIDPSKKAITVINGLPGAGKSSFIINYLEEMLELKKADFVFYFNSYSLTRLYSKLINSQDSINDQQVWEELGKYNLDYTKIPPSLLSYLLNYKSVYFIIDGIDKEADCENIISNLNRYINRYHSKNRRLKVLISSRIKDFKLQQLLIETIELKTLTPDEIRDFFFEKTEELKMDLLKNPNFGRIVDSDRSVLRFNDRLTQTPLFAEVVIIILKERGLDNLLVEFHQSIASIYKLFIRVLYERSPNGTNGYDDFYVLYRELALNTWELGNSFDVAEILKVFGGTAFNTQFMLANGLLVQNDKKHNVYSFIHQTIPDILAIEALALKNDFTIFENATDLREDLQIYLKDEIKTVPQYCTLLSSNPSVASGLFDRNFFNKISQYDLNHAPRMIIKCCINYIINHKNLKNPDHEAILKIFWNLGQWQNSTFRILLDEAQIYPKTKELLFVFLSFQNEEVNNYIVQLILSNTSKDILMDLLATNQYLKKIVDSYFLKTSLENEAKDMILFALESDIVNKKNQYKLKFVDGLESRTDDEILFYLRRQKIKTEVFFKEYSNRAIATTKRLNRLLIEIGFQEIFIPKGAYNVNSKLITNPKTITIAKTPSQISLKENNLNMAISKMQNEVRYDMWSFEQFQIGYAYFEGTLQNGFDGFFGLHSTVEVKYEAVKENNINKISFAYFETNNDNSNIVVSSPNTGLFQQIVFWRAIRIYQ